MKLKPLNPKQTKSLLVAALLSFVIAAPVMSQPLGLATVWKINPQDLIDENDQLESNPVNTAALAAPEVFDFTPEGLSRSQNNLIVSDDDNIIDESESDESEIAKMDVEAEAEDLETDKAEIDQAESQDSLFKEVDKLLYISASELNMRQKPDVNSEIVAKIPMGTKISCTGESDEWLKINYDEQTGYVAAEYTSSEMVFVPVDQTRYVNASSLNVRSDASTDGEIIEKLSQDAKVSRIGVGDGWSQIKTASGNTGYVSSEYLTDEVPASVIAAQQAAQAASAPGQNTVNVQQGSTYGSADKSTIVEIAWSGLGVPYVYAGSSLNGFDCSGFTSWVYRQVGIDIPRSSYAYGSVGSAVSLDSMQPGDVIAMDANPRDGVTSITHVGIYVGNGQMLHASTSRRRIEAVNVNTFFSYGITPITVRRIVD